jgi:pimeloyl-ACP methyl ester carboxylesterase
MLSRRSFVFPIVITSVIAVAVALPVPATATPSTTTTTLEASFTPKLTYVACPRGEDLPARTRCGELTVPLDWQAADDGRTIVIAVRVTRGRNSNGGLTWNPGGPGGSAIDRLADLYPDVPRSVKDAFDFITWDPRGVGRSEPKLQGCSQLPNVAPPTTGPVDWLAYWQEVSDTEGAASADCFAANPDVAPYLGTWQVIRDLDALRVALGYQRWNYWGMSYGTRIGRAYAEAFPNSLRALIQDGPVMANESITRFGATSPAATHTSYLVFAAVEGRRLYHKIRVVNQYLADEVIPMGTWELDRWTFQGSLNSSLRKPSLITDARRLVNWSYNYVTADTNRKQARAQRALRRIVERTTPDPVSDQYLINFINCADYADRPTVSTLASMSASAERTFGTEYGLEVVRSALCLGLPSGYSPPVNMGDATVTLRNPPLFLLASGDAGTPWAWGRSMANTFARSRAVTLNSTEHVSFFRTPSTCVKDIAERYLLTLQRPRRDVFCPYAPYVAPTP